MCLFTEPPEWESEPQSQLSMIGSDVHIKCSASGSPQPTITWMVNGLPLQGQSPIKKKSIILYCFPFFKTRYYIAYNVENILQVGRTVSKAKWLLKKSTPCCENHPELSKTLYSLNWIPSTETQTLYSICEENRPKQSVSPWCHSW